MNRDHTTAQLTSIPYPSGLAWIANVLLELDIRLTTPTFPGHWIDGDGQSEISQEAYDHERWHLPVLQERRQFRFEPMLEVIWEHRLDFARHPERPTIVYVRDPRDAIYSHYRRHMAEHMSLAEYLRWPESWPYHLQSLFGLPPGETWAYFHLFWLAMSEVMTVKVVRFESMRADGVGIIRDVLTLLGVERTDAEIARALECSTFERAKKAMEQVQSETGQSYSPNRRGKVGEWQEIYGPQELACFDGPAAYAMQRLGYDVPESLRGSFPTGLPELRQIPVSAVAQRCVDSARESLAARAPARAMDILRESLPPDADPSGEHASLLNAMVALRWTVAIFTEQHSAAAAALRAFDLFYDLNSAFCSSSCVLEVLRHARYGWSAAPRTLETDYVGYDIVHYAHTFFAVKLELGSTNVYTICPQQLSQYTCAGFVLTDITPEALKRRLRLARHQDLPETLQRVIGTDWGLTEAEQETLFIGALSKSHRIVGDTEVAPPPTSNVGIVRFDYKGYDLLRLTDRYMALLRHGQAEGAQSLTGASINACLDQIDICIPGPWPLRMDIGPLSTFSREDQAALQSVQESFLKDPAMPGMAAALAGFYRRVKDYRNAINVLQRALTVLPDNISIQCLMAETLFERGDSLPSKVLLESLLERVPDHALIHITLGEILYKWGKREAGKASLLTAVRLDPMAAQAHSDLAVIFVNERDFEQAITCIRRAHQADPYHPDVIANYERIMGVPPPQPI